MNEINIDEPNAWEEANNSLVAFSVRSYPQPILQSENRPSRFAHAAHQQQLGNAMFVFEDHRPEI